MGETKKTFPLIPVVLSLLVLLCLAGGLRNYNALLNSDQYAYLSYGRAIARGGFTVDFPLLDLLRERSPEGTHRPLFYGRRFYSDGEVISTLEPGFPLLLAAAIRLGGLPAAYGVNVALLAVFIVAFFLVIRAEAPAGALAALAAVFLTLAWDGHIGIGYSLHLMRDIPPVAFFWLGLFLFRKGLRPDRRLFPAFFLGVACLAASALARLTNLVVMLPLVPYALISIRRKEWPRWQLALWAAGSVVAFLLVFLPQFLEEAFFMGDPLAFVRRAQGAFAGFFQGAPGRSRHTFALANLAINLPRNLFALYSLITLPGAVLLAAGLFACRRRIFTWLIMLPVPLLHLLLFSAYGHHARRYRFPLFPFISYFIASGAIWILRLWRDFREKMPAPARPVWSLSAALGSAAVLAALWAGGDAGHYLTAFFFSALVAALTPVSGRFRAWRPDPGGVFTLGLGLILLPYLTVMVTQRRSFNWQDVQRLRREIEDCVPAGSVVLGQRYLIQNVDAYTHAYGISLGNLAIALEAEPPAAVAFVEEAGYPVFVLDNRGFRSMERELIYLRRYFDLEPACRWRSEELKIDNPYYSGDEFLTLYRISLPRRAEVELNLPTPARSDYLVFLDAGFLPDGGSGAGPASVRVNDRRCQLELGDGLNYFVIEAGDISIPETSLAIAFHRPLPAAPLIGLTPLGDTFRFNFGVESDPADELFVVRGLFLDRGRRRHYRVMGPEAEVLLPRLVPPGRAGWLELRIRNMLPGELSLNLAIKPVEGRVYGRTVPPGREWRTVRFPLPEMDPRQGSFTLAISAEPVVSGPEQLEELAGSAFLALDWIEIGWDEDGQPPAPRPPL